MSKILKALRRTESKISRSQCRILPRKSASPTSRPGKKALSLAARAISVAAGAIHSQRYSQSPDTTCSTSTRRLRTVPHPHQDSPSPRPAQGTDGVKRNAAINLAGALAIQEDLQVLLIVPTSALHRGESLGLSQSPG